MTDFNLVLSQVRQRLEILYQIVDELEQQGGGGGGTSDYTQLDNLPKLNSKTITGSHDGAYYGLADAAALDDKADKSTTYTKTQVDGLLDDKADKSTTYTKTEVDTALSGKANAATTYTKTETDAEIASEIVGAINDLDVSAVGGSTKYLTTISEANGLIDATAASPDIVPTTGSDKLITSGGVKTYVDAETTAREEECGAIANLGAKNMCPYNTFSATATSGTGATPVNDQPINLPAGTYIMTYTQTATTGASSIRFSYNGTSVLNFTINNDSTLTKEKEFTLPSAANQIKVFSNAINDYSNFMIRPKAISDDTYVPYGPTNAELNANKITMLNILGAGQRIAATPQAPLNFNDEPFTSVGRFSWLSTATLYITNCPTYINGENKGGVLETSFIQGPSTVLQTARPSAGADSPTIFWQRFRYGSGTSDNPYRWTSWYAFTGTEVQIPSAQTTNLGGEMRSVASLEESDIEPIEEPQEER